MRHNWVNSPWQWNKPWTVQLKVSQLTSGFCTSPGQTAGHAEGRWGKVCAGLRCTAPVLLGCSQRTRPGALSEEETKGESPEQESGVNLKCRHPDWSKALLRQNTETMSFYPWATSHRVVGECKGCSSHQGGKILQEGIAVDQTELCKVLLKAENKKQTFRTNFQYKFWWCSGSERFNDFKLKFSQDKSKEGIGKINFLLECCGTEQQGDHCLRPTLTFILFMIFHSHLITCCTFIIWKFVVMSFEIKTKY